MSPFGAHTHPFGVCSRAGRPKVDRATRKKEKTLRNRCPFGAPVWTPSGSITSRKKKKIGRDMHHIPKAEGNPKLRLACICRCERHEEKLRGGNFGLNQCDEGQCLRLGHRAKRKKLGVQTLTPPLTPPQNHRKTERNGKSLVCKP